MDKVLKDLKNIKDDDTWFDMVCANNFIVGNLDGKIPVERNRELWELRKTQIIAQSNHQLLEEIKAEVIKAIYANSDGYSCQDGNRFIELKKDLLDYLDSKEGEK